MVLPIKTIFTKNLACYPMFFEILLSMRWKQK